MLRPHRHPWSRASSSPLVRTGAPTRAWPTAVWPYQTVMQRPAQRRWWAQSCPLLARAPPPSSPPRPRPPRAPPRRRPPSVTARRVRAQSAAPLLTQPRRTCRRRPPLRLRARCRSRLSTRSRSSRRRRWSQQQSRASPLQCRVRLRRPLRSRQSRHLTALAAVATTRWQSRRGLSSTAWKRGTRRTCRRCCHASPPSSRPRRIGAPSPRRPRRGHARTEV